MATKTETPEARKARIFNRASTPTLVMSALMLEAKTERTPEERMALAWTCDELVRRVGGLPEEGPESDAFDALLDTDLSYLQCLLVTFPQLAGK